MRPVAASLLFILALIPPAAWPATMSPTRDLRELDGLRTLFHRLRQRIEERFEDNAIPRVILRSNASYRRFATPLAARERRRLRIAYAQCVGDWQQFQSVAARVLGSDANLHPLSYVEAYDAFVGGKPHDVPAAANTAARDRYVYRMYMLGYTPREITDVMAGRITLQTLQRAGRMLALGYGREAVADYLDARYSGLPPSRQSDGDGVPLRLGSAARAAAPASAADVMLPRPRVLTQRELLDRHVVRYASGYGVDPDLVRAIITHESSWRSGIRSPAGALGIMQLMPSTADMLGVDPLDPEQNIEGGVRYLAGLMDMFDGDLDAALVSYNAGPAYARKWRQGEAVLYGETRAYLQRVKKSYAERRF